MISVQVQFRLTLRRSFSSAGFCLRLHPIGKIDEVDLRVCVVSLALARRPVTFMVALHFRGIYDRLLGLSSSLPYAHC